MLLIPRNGYGALTCFAMVLTMLFGCANSNSSYQKTQSAKYAKRFVTDSFPLSLEGLAFADFKDAPFNSKHTSFIDESISKYVNSVQVEGFDQEVYWGTVQLKHEEICVYVNLFQHPSGKLNANYIMVKSDTLFQASKDYNLHAMYNLQDDTLNASDLHGLFLADVPDMKIVKRDDTHCLQVIRLIHNGTYNAIEVSERPLHHAASFYERIDTFDVSLRNMPVAAQAVPEGCLENYLAGVFYSKEARLLPLGDYNGDDYLDTLVAGLELLEAAEDTTIIMQYGDDYMSWQKWAFATPHDLWIKSNDKINPLRLKIKTAIAGVAYACNVGDLDGSPGDELAVVFFTPDYSNINTMFLFGYQKEKWQVLCDWWVREDDLDEVTHVSAFSTGKVLVRTLDFEAMMHDTIVSISNPYQQTHTFEIE